MSNNVAFPRRESYTSRELFKKINAWIEVLDPIDNKFMAIEQVGMGQPNAQKNYHISKDLSLVNLK